MMIINPYRFGTSYDTDAQSFFTASGITDLTQKNAVNQLVLDLKSNSLWTKMKALYPVVGGNATAHSYNLINTSLYQLSFSSGWTHSTTGMTPNGTSAYANTGINLSSLITPTNGNIGVYLRTTTSSGTGEFGAYDGSHRVHIFFNYSGTTGYASYDNVTSFSATNLTGLYSLGRCSSVDANTKILRNGSTIIYDSNLGASVLPATNFYLGASNENGTATFFSSRQNAFTYISTGLTNSELSSLFTIINTFQTSLSRNV